MFPQTTINSESLPETVTIGKSFLFDFDTGDFVIADGKLVEASDNDAIEVWINKIIRTEKFKFKIYEKSDEDEYGITIQDLIIGRKYALDFIEMEVKREFTDAILKHPSIESLSDWSFVRNNRGVTIDFTVNLTNGTTLEQEVNL